KSSLSPKQPCLSWTKLKQGGRLTAFFIKHAVPGVRPDRTFAMLPGSLEVFSQPLQRPSSPDQEPAMDRSSRNFLNTRHLDRFTGDSLFDRIARSVCTAGCLPRKELFEAWEVARRVRRRFRGGRVVDLACGHGLLAHILLLLDNSSPEALAVDPHMPASAGALTAALEAAWPRLRGRIRFERGDMELIALTPDDLVVSVHA